MPKGLLRQAAISSAGTRSPPRPKLPSIWRQSSRRKAGSSSRWRTRSRSIASIIGASWTGARAMTATSGPGFSLMMENIGYAAMTETPCVVVNVQRGGPSTGQPTMAAQGDMMQCRFGSHGDYCDNRPLPGKRAGDVRAHGKGIQPRRQVPGAGLSDGRRDRSGTCGRRSSFPDQGRADWPEGARARHPAVQGRMQTLFPGFPQFGKGLRCPRHRSHAR